MANNLSVDLQPVPPVVPDPAHSDPHDHEEQKRRKRKRRTKKRHRIANGEENEEAKSPVAHDSYPGLSSTQDLLGEPGRMLSSSCWLVSSKPHSADFPSSQWPSFEMLEPTSSGVEPIHSSPPISSKREESPPPWPDAGAVIAISNTDADPTQQVTDATELSLSILEHAQKWNLTSYPVELLSDTFEAFGKCIFSLKYRLDCVDTIADSISKMSDSRQDDQVK